MKNICKYMVAALLVFAAIALPAAVFATEGKPLIIDDYDEHPLLMPDYDCENCCEDYIPAPALFATTDPLNFRSGPDLHYPRMRVLPIGTIVTMISYNPEGFSAISVGEQRGYVYTQFLRPFTPPPVAPAALANTAIARPAYAGAVEMLQWSEVQRILPMGAQMRVFDVNSGLTYYVRMFANGRHADVETITRADTDILFQSLGGRWSWDARPIITTFVDIYGNTRTLAASIHGMPHDVSTIFDNGKNGHICIHFLGVVNRNPQWGQQMQNAIWQAYRFANN